MTYIVEFFKTIADVISSGIDYVVDFFAGLVDFFTQIPEYVSIVKSYIDLLPTGIKVFVVMVLSASLIFVVIGRRGN